MQVNKLPLALYGSQEVKQLDHLASEKYQISSYQLMCRAGQAAFNLLEERWPQAAKIAVLCGPGNNGGDGFVLARLALAKGMNVKVYQVGAISPHVSAAAKQAREEWLASKKEIMDFTGQKLEVDVIVDAILGTGIKDHLAKEFKDAINAINLSKRPVLAIDLPSGLNADTGNFEQVVNANATITFIGMKVGLLCTKNIEVMGKIYFDNLGVSANLYTEVKPVAFQLEYAQLAASLPPRRLSAHKGDYGHVCVIGGGQTGYSGAACLAGEAALRSGAGLVSLVVPLESLPLLARAPAELMCYGLEQPKALIPLLEKATHIVLGPGLGQVTWAKLFFEEALKARKPMVIDADGLNLLAQSPQKRNDWILTPHPGEASRLLKKSISDIQNNRIKAATELHEKYGGIIVLKGAGTVIVDENGGVFINAGGFPALATGGTGDVLAGLIGGLIAQKISLSLAAKIAVCIHTTAADLEQSLGTRGMIASDLFLHIRSLLNPTRDEE